MMSKPRVAILASTNGTILPEVVKNSVDFADFVLLLTNKSECGATEKATKLHIPVVSISAKNTSREQWDARAVQVLREHDVEIIILIGFMRILSPVFVNAFAGRILNVHPSLLPKYSGGMDTDVHRMVIDNKESESGATVHLVTEHLDAGPIICQQAVSLDINETVDSLKTKVQQVESQLYPQAILKLVSKTEKSACL
jgi:formyltetrahydrofolate-dependent phosphoribosylglycinamide formyltransferase